MCAPNINLFALCRFDSSSVAVEIVEVHRRKRYSAWHISICRWCGLFPHICIVALIFPHNSIVVTCVVLLFHFSHVCILVPHFHFYCFCVVLVSFWYNLHLFRIHTVCLCDFLVLLHVLDNNLCCAFYSLECNRRVSHNYSLWVDCNEVFVCVI